MLVVAPTALRVIVLHEFGEAGLADLNTFRACLQLLAEERFGTKRRAAAYHEQAQADRARKSL